MNNRFCQLTETLAYNNPGAFRVKMAALVVQRKNILGWGFNKDKTHPIQKRYCKNEYSIFLHAEISAIANALRLGEDIEDATMYVARVLKNGEPRISKPCSGCLMALKHFGILECFYIGCEGKWLRQRL